MHIISQFLSQAKSRSLENSESFYILYSAGKFGVCIGLLRQELDTLIRLSYLWRPETTNHEATNLMELSVRGLPWERVNANGKMVKLTDREMVNLAEHLGGWEQLIYSFGCKLIHLSNFHDYKTVDPFSALPEHELETIASYLRSHHGFPDRIATLGAIVEYLPNVMEKLAGNVSFYIEELEERHLQTAP